MRIEAITAIEAIVEDVLNKAQRISRCDYSVDAQIYLFIYPFIYFFSCDSCVNCLSFHCLNGQIEITVNVMVQTLCLANCRM